MKKNTFLSMTAVVVAIVFISIRSADAATYILDFGTPVQQLYEGGVFTGTPTAATDAGTSGSNGSYTGIEYDLGDIVISFGTVYAANNYSGGTTALTKLTKDYIGSSGTNPVVPGVVTFNITTTSADLDIEFEFIGSFFDYPPTITITDDNNALNTVTGTITSNTDFQSLGSLTGSTSYTGSFFGTSGSNGDAGQIAGARITVIPEPYSVILLLGGLVAVALMIMRDRSKLQMNNRR